jgi:hypothetical protein
MRRLLITWAGLLAVACVCGALPAAAGAKTPITLTKVRADWIGSSHRIFVDTHWTPKSLETQVTVRISVNGRRLRTLRVNRWVIGRKLFQLTVPSTVAADSKARIEVRVSSGAGIDHRTVSLDLP